MNLKGKGGFGDRPKEERVELARRAGSVSHPNKGFGSMSKKERSEAGRRAVKARWAKYRKEQDEEYSKL